MFEYFIIIMQEIIPFGILQNFLNDYLEWQDIVSCYKTAKFFQVLPFNRLKSKYAIWKGLKYCVKKQYFNEIKILTKVEKNKNLLLQSFELACKLPNQSIIKFLYDIILDKNISISNINLKKILSEASLKNIIFIWQMFIEKHKSIYALYCHDLEQLLELNITAEKLRYLHSINILNLSKEDYDYIVNFCWNKSKYNLVRQISKLYQSSFRYYHALPFFYLSIPFAELLNKYVKKDGYHSECLYFPSSFSTFFFGFIISTFYSKKIFSILGNSCMIYSLSYMISNLNQFL